MQNIKGLGSLNLTIEHGVFHRTKLLVVIESVYCQSFTVEVANPTFHNVATSQEVDVGHISYTHKKTTLAMTNLRVGEYMLSTTTSNFVSSNGLRLIVKFRVRGVLMFYI